MSQSTYTISLSTPIITLINSNLQSNVGKMMSIIKKEISFATSKGWNDKIQFFNGILLLLANVANEDSFYSVVNLWLQSFVHMTLAFMYTCNNIPNADVLAQFNDRLAVSFKLGSDATFCPGTLIYSDSFDICELNLFGELIGGVTELGSALRANLVQSKDEFFALTYDEMRRFGFEQAYHCNFCSNDAREFVRSICDTIRFTEIKMKKVGFGAETIFSVKI